MDRDTIAAIATAPGTGGIGIIRISGPESFAVADRMFRSPSGKKLTAQKTHTIHYGFIEDPSNGETLDQVLVMLMRAPHTYTGEDTVEINCHGGPYVEQQILETAIRCGASMAEPGEFSKRAFISGKMDLSQAEAVMDLIAAQSKMSERSSMEQLKGALAKEIAGYREVLLELVTFIEANIDYPEYDVEEVTYDTMKEKTELLLKDLKTLHSTADTGRRIREGIRTAIVGKPNAGKSSLMNRMLRQERAIVTEIPGTTRDIIEEFVDLGGIPLRLADTAGIRETGDIVEKIGVDRAKEYLQACDLVLWVVDGNETTAPDPFIETALNGKLWIKLYNKADLGVFDKNKCADGIILSTLTGEGMDQLEQKIRDLFFEGRVSVSGQGMITNLRQKEALERAIRSLESARIGLQEGMEQDIIMIDYTECYDALGEISGHSLKEDVISEIFKRFCLGK